MKDLRTLAPVRRKVENPDYFTFQLASENGKNLKLLSAMTGISKKDLLNCIIEGYFEDFPLDKTTTEKETA